MFNFPRARASALAAGVAVTLTMVACSQDALPPTAISSENSSAAARDADRRRATVTKQIDIVRRETRKFHNVSNAIAVGYVLPNPAVCVSSPAGAMGIHWVHSRRAADIVVAAEQPEVLLYIPNRDGGFELVGVEYFAPVLVRNISTDAVAPWFSKERWGAGYQVVNPAPTLFGQTFNGPMAGHEPGMPWHYNLHAWIWKNNPSGMFADFNPSISCP